MISAPTSEPVLKYRFPAPAPVEPVFCCLSFSIFLLFYALSKRFSHPGRKDRFRSVDRILECKNVFVKRI